jgi:hypothetical protein
VISGEVAFIKVRRHEPTVPGFEDGSTICHGKRWPVTGENCRGEVNNTLRISFIARAAALGKAVQ